MEDNKIKGIILCAKISIYKLFFCCICTETHDCNINHLFNYMACYQYTRRICNIYYNIKIEYDVYK